MLKTVIFVFIVILFLYIIYRVYKLIADNFQFDDYDSETYASELSEQIERHKSAGNLQEAFNVAKSHLSKNCMMLKNIMMLLGI